MRERLDTLDAMVTQLRRTEPAIADGHFTEAVMTQLGRYHQLPAWLADTLVLIATVLGSGVAAWQTRSSIYEILVQALSSSAPSLIGTTVALVYLLSGSILWLARDATVS